VETFCASVNITAEPEEEPSIEHENFANRWPIVRNRKEKIARKKLQS
jgi:hypothetical protein